MKVRDLLVAVVLVLLATLTVVLLVLPQQDAEANKSNRFQVTPYQTEGFCGVLTTIKDSQTGACFVAWCRSVTSAPKDVCQ